MKLAFYIFLLTPSFSCNAKTKPYIEEKKINKDSTFNVKIIDNTLIITNKQDTIYSKPDLVRNYMSLNTSLIQSQFNNQFSLSYEYTASIDKIKVLCNFLWKDNRIYLLSKTSIKFRRNGVFLKKIFFRTLEQPKITFDLIESLGEKINYQQADEDGKTVMVLFDETGKELGKLSYNIFPQSFFIKFPYIEYYINLLNANNLYIINNIAYYLEQAGAYHEAIYLLEKIIAEYPNRTVAYLNLADAYWGLQQSEKAKQAYQKYYKLMTEQQLQNKIPARVKERM